MLSSIVSAPQLLAMVKLVETLPAGDFAEVGVYKGGSAWELYKVSLASGRTLHLFDTFTGTPFFTEDLDRHKIDAEFAAELTPVVIGQLMPAAKVYVGVYPDTHPKDLPPLAFIHCDCDQYLSYTAVIEKLWPLVVLGGVMLFDDYPYLAGAKRAVDEHFAPIDLKKCFSRYYVVKEPDFG
jgi:hypothetical protein